MVCPWPTGRAVLSQALWAMASSTNSWRGTFAIAAKHAEIANILGNQLIQQALYYHNPSSLQIQPRPQGRQTAVGRHVDGQRG